MKSDTEEKYLQQVNRVIDYINSHLNEPLRVETLAREVCLSEYHSIALCGPTCTNRWLRTSPGNEWNVR